MRKDRLLINNSFALLKFLATTRRPCGRIAFAFPFGKVRFAHAPAHYDVNLPGEHGGRSQSCMTLALSWFY